MTSERNAAAMEARAKALRAEFEKDLVAGDERASMASAKLRQDQYGATERANMAELGAKVTRDKVAELKADNEASRAEIANAKRDGLPQRVAELEEAISLNDRQIVSLEVQVEADVRAAAAARAEAAAKAAEAEKVIAAQEEVDQKLLAAEKEIDDLESRAAYLREADGHDSNVARLEQEIADLRASGENDEADRKTQDLIDERIAADAKRGSAADIDVDESKLDILDVPPDGSTASAAPDAMSDLSSDALMGTAPKQDGNGDGLVDPAAEHFDTSNEPEPPGPGDGGPTNPGSAGASEDGAALAARAAQLRTELVARVTDDRDLARQTSAANRDRAAAEAAVKSIDEELEFLDLAHERDAALANTEKQIADLEAAGRGDEATELREQLEIRRGYRANDDEQITALKADRERAVDELTSAKNHADQVAKEQLDQIRRRNSAEEAIDALEQKARLLQEGKTDEAARVVVDEAAIAAGLGGSPTAGAANPTEETPAPADTMDPTGATAVEQEVTAGPDPDDQAPTEGTEAAQATGSASEEDPLPTEEQYQLEEEPYQPDATSSDAAGAGLTPTVDDAVGYEDSGSDFAPAEEEYGGVDSEFEDTDHDGTDLAI